MTIHIARRCAFCNNPIPESRMFLVFKDKAFCTWRHYGMWLSIQPKKQERPP